jgi:2-polyprenyl-3-methyl-5-hydroxy-6-metoxy-1,4-benzoquinol methylase
LDKLVDRVTEAYYYNLGYAFGQKVRERIHWICAQTKGQKVLDVGCSQGITSILLGKEGKQVLGIDISEEAIEYANKSLKETPYNVQNLVEFKRADFLTYNFWGEKYDTIIFGEILEHLINPKEFFNKAKTILNKDGRIIVTVPFGINDYPDHKHTFYIYDLIGLADASIQITNYKIFGKWIGVVYEHTNSNQNAIKLDNMLLNNLEKAFYKLERDLYDKIRLKESRIKELEENIDEEKKNNYLYQKEISLKIADLAKELYEQNAEINQMKKQLSEQHNDKQQYKEKISELNDMIKQLSQQLLTVTKEKIDVKQELLNMYEKEATLLKAHRKLMLRYQALSNSKLGRLTLFYWKLIKSFKRER